MKKKERNEKKLLVMIISVSVVQSSSHHYDTCRPLSISAPGSQLPFSFLSYAYVPQPEGMKGKRRAWDFGVRRERATPYAPRLRRSASCKWLWTPSLYPCACQRRYHTRCTLALTFFFFTSRHTPSLSFSFTLVTVMHTHTQVVNGKKKPAGDDDDPHTRVCMSTSAVRYPPSKTTSFSELRFRLIVPIEMPDTPIHKSTDERPRGA